jgi:Leucine-rich repeat (LRR) protein
MFIKKDLRKIPTILDEAVDCHVYDAANSDDENDKTRGNRHQDDPKKKRTKREEPLKVLRLGRRKQEFEHCVKVLCQPSYVPKLKYLEVLNLYECDIHDLEGFGTMFEAAAPNLETLNLGRNPLTNGIPYEFTKVRSLKHLWLDDCKLTGALPKALLHMPNIESLRLPNNQITHLPVGGIDTNLTKNSDGEEFEFDDNQEKSKVVPMLNLKILCLDRNKLGGSHKEKPEITTNKTETETEGDATMNMDENLPSSPANPRGGAIDADIADAPDDEESSSDARGPTFLPSNLAEWAPNLEECFLRHNGFFELGVRKWPSTLKILQVSSNKLTNLDELVGDGASQALTHLYANGNRLESLPEGILKTHPHLERLVVSHNPPLTEMPQEVWQRLKDDKGGDDDDKRKACQILWLPNPNLKDPGAEDCVPEVVDSKMRVC